jgi:hypothetical protein
MQRSPQDAAAYQWSLVTALLGELKPSKNFERSCFMDENKIKTVKQREEQFVLGPSKIVPGINGVFSTKARKFDLIRPPSSRRLLDYPGVLLTLREFKAMKFACYTCIDLSLETLQTDFGINFETERMVLLGDVRFLAAQIVCKAGQGNQKGNNHHN